MKGAEFTASPDGIPIAYEARGSGAPALVFVHGWSCDRGYWAGQFDSFARRFQVVAVDLAGHGDSGLGRADWTIAAFGADVAAVTEALRLERVILIGHSMGGDVILEAARRLPGRIAGLVWVDVYRKLGVTRTDDQVAAFMQPFRDDFAASARGFVRAMFPPGTDPALVERVVEDMAAAPPAVALPAMDSARTFDRIVPGLLAELALPVVAINSGMPPVDPSLAQHGVEVVLMPGVGHFPMMEDPEAFNARLESVIARWTGPGVDSH